MSGGGGGRGGGSCPERVWKAKKGGRAGAAGGKHVLGITPREGEIASELSLVFRDLGERGSD